MAPNSNVLRLVMEGQNAIPLAVAEFTLEKLFTDSQRVM